MRALTAIGIILLIVWFGAWLIFKVTGLAIHLLLVIGAIMLIVGLVRKVTRPSDLGRT